MEMIFYSRCYNMGSGVDILAKKITLAITVVVELHTVAQILWFDKANFNFWIKCFSSEEHFSFLSVLVQVAVLISYFLLEIAFSSNLRFAKLQSFLSIRLNRNGLSGDTKISKFLLFNFSQYNFKKIIRTLRTSEQHGVEQDILSSVETILRGVIKKYSDYDRRYLPVIELHTFITSK